MREDEINSLISKYFSFLSYGEDEYTYYFIIIGALNGLSIDEAFSRLYDDLVSQGHYPLLYKAGNDLILKVSKKASQKKNRYGLISSVLFIATTLSVIFTGYLSVESYNQAMSELGNIVSTSFGSNILLDTAAFSLAVLVPLYFHEVGHYVITLKSKTPATFPVPIPAPYVSPLGTFGALIMMRYLPKRIKDLVKLGISGPLVGVILSMAALYLSSLISPVLPADVIAKGVSLGVLSPIAIAPLGAIFISHLNPAPAGFIRVMNPAAEAAYLILLIHFANLLPIGQLDGGHIFRALTSRRIHFLTSAAVSLAAIAFSFLYPFLGWLGIFVVLAWLISGTRPHVGAANTLSHITLRERVFYGILYFVLILVTLPVPTG